LLDPGTTFKQPNDVGPGTCLIWLYSVMLRAIHNDFNETISFCRDLKGQEATLVFQGQREIVYVV